MRTLVYCRVSTREQGDSGLGLEAQRARCLEEVGRRGWQLAGAVEEVASASGRQRPKLEEALRMLDLGHADVLMVARLDRLARSTLEFATIASRAMSKDWGVVILDPSVDLQAGPASRMFANLLMTFAQYERELISQRTKDALAAKLAREGGVKTWGYRPQYTDPVQVRRMLRWHEEEGMSYREIARRLTAAGVPTPSGGEVWNHRTISDIIRREAPSDV